MLCTEYEIIVDNYSWFFFRSFIKLHTIFTYSETCPMDLVRNQNDAFKLLYNIVNILANLILTYQIICWNYIVKDNFYKILWIHNFFCGYQFSLIEETLYFHGFVKVSIQAYIKFVFLWSFKFEVHLYQPNPQNLVLNTIDNENAVCVLTACTSYHQLILFSGFSCYHFFYSG